MNWLQQVYLVFAQSRASLYHFTTLENALKIIKSNHLLKGSEGSVSFTRYGKNFDWKLDHPFAELIVKFEFDQDKLRQNYSIKPFYPKHWAQDSKGKMGRFNQFEERIWKDVKNLKKYIKEISILNPIEYWFKHEKLARNYLALPDDKLDNLYYWYSRQQDEKYRLGGKNLFFSYTAPKEIYPLIIANNNFYYIQKLIKIKGFKVDNSTKTLLGFYKNLFDTFNQEFEEWKSQQ